MWVLTHSDTLIISPLSPEKNKTKTSNSINTHKPQSKQQLQPINALIWGLIPATLTRQTSAFAHVLFILKRSRNNLVFFKKQSNHLLHMKYHIQSENVFFHLLFFSFFCLHPASYLCTSPSASHVSPARHLVAIRVNHPSFLWRPRATHTCTQGLSEHEDALDKRKSKDNAKVAGWEPAGQQKAQRKKTERIIIKRGSDGGKVAWCVKRV